MGRTMRVLTIFSIQWVYPVMLMAQSCSVWTLLLISLERYSAVCRPFQRYRRVTRKKVTPTTPSFSFPPQTVLVWEVLRSLLAIVFVAVAYNLCRFWEHFIALGSLLGSLSWRG